MPLSSNPAQTFDLQRFVDAQQGVYEEACAELEQGAKQSHWIWFVFPQMRGLGRSRTADHFGIVSLAEAQAYLAHPLLGPRLRHAAGLMLATEGRTALEIMGYPDDLKLRSSMTLFARAAPEPDVFKAVLDRYFDGREDPATLRLVGDGAR